MADSDSDSDAGAPPPPAATSGYAVTPVDMRGMRACMRCTLVKNNNQFYDDGCENCPFLEMRQDQKRVSECTSAYFEGMVGVMTPKDSWAARWQTVDAFRPGIYAMEVHGQLPAHIRTYCSDRSIRIRAVKPKA